MCNRALGLREVGRERERCGHPGEIGGFLGFRLFALCVINPALLVCWCFARHFFELLLHRTQIVCLL